MFWKKDKTTICDLCGVELPKKDDNGNPNTILLNGVRVCSKCHEYETWCGITPMWKLKVWGHITHEYFATKRDKSIKRCVDYARIWCESLGKKKKKKKK